MRRRFATLSIALLIPVAWLFAATAASATSADMEALPTFARHGCQNCHAGAGVSVTVVPVQTAGDLNTFGAAWLQNGRTWDEILASLNSDGDGCTNGFELGDPEGSWRPGLSRPAVGDDQSNPGRSADCALPINEQSWGVLKSLFGE